MQKYHDGTYLSSASSELYCADTHLDIFRLGIKSSALKSLQRSYLTLNVLKKEIKFR